MLVVGHHELLRPYDRAHDGRVAGIASGAGSLHAGLVLGALSPSSGRDPLVLNGKICCKVDAQYDAIDVGDLLTTSPTPSHARKAADQAIAFGEVGGKALGPLPLGTV